MTTLMARIRSLAGLGSATESPATESPAAESPAAESPKEQPPKKRKPVSVRWEAADRRAALIFLKGQECYVSSEHFRRVGERVAQRALFKKSVKRVHAEVFAHCNRRCRFCPNVEGTRLSAGNYLDEAIYLRVLSDLASIDYDRLFGFHQYNEPLADRIILDRIRQAREQLPKSQLVTSSNGDYLDGQYLKELSDAGLDGLNVSIYGPGDGAYDRGYVRDRMRELADRLGFHNSMQERGPHSVQITGEYRHTWVRIIGRDLETIGYNRGDLVEAGPRLRRSSPCFSPFEDVTVDWRGNVLPCCNVYPDAPGHRQHVTGNLRDGRSIFNHYADSALVEWRRSLIRFYPAGGICEGCSRLEYPGVATEENIALLDGLARELGN